MSYMNYSRGSQPTKHDQNADTNLDQDVANSRNTKYHDNQLEVKQYLYDILSPTTKIFTKYGIDSEQDLPSVDLMVLLKDGEILCKLGSFLSLPVKNPTTIFKNSKMPFIQMENISFFLSLCQLIDINQNEIFQTVDLFEAKDPFQVIITIMSFSRIANSLDSKNYPITIGKKNVKTKPAVPVKPFKLRSY